MQLNRDPILITKGIFLDLATIDQDDLDLSALQGTLPQWHMHRQSLPGQLQDMIADAEIVVANKVVLDEPTLASAQRLQLICVAATGTNNVDLQACARRGISVCNARAYATTSVVEHVFALMLALNRQLYQYQRAIDAGAWQQSDKFCLLDFPIRELYGQTIGIIGGGELGLSVSKLAQALSMRVLLAERRGAKPRPGRNAFEEVLRQSDIISIHCPLTAETQGLIGAAELAQMKPDALLIQTSRGGIVDEIALRNALDSGHLGGAAVDVLSNEPPNSGNPLLDAGLPNLIITPHIAWASHTARQRLINEITENIRGFLSGQPRNIVD